MVVREDLVSSAVTFLQDPNVAAAPFEKKTGFLQNKGLTQEEVDISLARAGESGSPQTRQNAYAYQQPSIQQQSPPQYGYSAYQGNWSQPPPRVPARDWRDYFILATAMSGLSYGAYVVAKRWISPLISPPTPAQLEQDKASIDEAFARAFNLIETLATDTTAIKAAEESRKERLDAALAEMETVSKEMQTSSRRRDDDTRRIGDEVRGLQSLIPKALKAQEETVEGRLKDLTTELKSLKLLVGNRITGPAAASGTQRGPVPSLQSTATVNGSTTPTDSSVAIGGTTSASEAPVAGAPSSELSATSSPYSTYARFSGGGARGGIPAWQLAASKKAETQPQPQPQPQKESKVETSEQSGDVDRAEEAVRD